MIVNSAMVTILKQILDVEPKYQESLLSNDFITNDAGIELIEIYANTEKLETRKLITNFMQEAGYTWLRKLHTRDTSPVYS